VIHTYFSLHATAVPLHLNIVSIENFFFKTQFIWNVYCSKLYKLFQCSGLKNKQMTPRVKDRKALNRLEYYSTYFSSVALLLLGNPLFFIWSVCRCFIIRNGEKIRNPTKYEN
jgi:hypothetical protein